MRLLAGVSGIAPVRGGDRQSRALPARRPIGRRRKDFADGHAFVLQRDAMNTAQSSAGRFRQRGWGAGSPQ